MTCDLYPFAIRESLSWLPQIRQEPAKSVLGGFGSPQPTSNGLSQLQLGRVLNKSCPGFEPTNALVKSMILVVCGPPQPPERCQLKRFGSISMRRRQNRGTAQLELVWHRQHSNTEDIFVSVPRIRNHPDGQPLASNCRSNPARWDPLPHNVGFGGGMRNLHCGSVDV